jgi:hypothetical protein
MSADHPPLGLVYLEQPGGVDGRDDALPTPALAPLPDLTAPGAALDGHYVQIVSAGWVRHPGGALLPIPPAQPNAAGNFVYLPQRGGVSPARNERSAGRFYEQVVEAAQFGQVNAYYHLNRLARYIHSLLAELNAPPLPKVRVFTCAHSGYHPSTGCFQPDTVLAGGHYRMQNSRRYDPPEEGVVATTGEIHLGPGRYYLKWGCPPLGAPSRTRRLAGKPYLHQPSHNPAILYHEYSHHLVRHTADFRCNSQRRPDRQSNAKSWLDEGTCDYLTAVMVGHSGFFAWQRAGLPAAHPRCRNLEPGRTLAEFDPSPQADPHYNGTIWATLLWRLRAALMNEHGWSGRAVDKALLQTLLAFGRTGVPNPHGQPTLRRSNMQRRSTLVVALGYLHTFTGVQV